MANLTIDQMEAEINEYKEIQRVADVFSGLMFYLTPPEQDELVYYYNDNGSQEEFNKVLVKMIHVAHERKNCVN